MRIFLAAVLTISISTFASSAEIKRAPGPDGADLISIRGILSEGDDLTFRKVAAASEKAIVVLDSQGGAVLAGLEIGRAIRLRGFATAVAPETLCASACALTWLAGSPRFIDSSSRLGFHAAYRVVAGKAAESGVGNALVGAYLSQIGMTESAIIYVTSAPPEGIDWLTPEKAEKVGISYELMRGQAQPNVTLTATTEPYDPMSAVTRFYSALSSADGEAAAALVIPEKRGQGPFNETSIHTFYSAMSTRLTLRSTDRLSENVVRVSYHYMTSTGRACWGRADVQTIHVYDRTLISRIKALDGC
ncbi:hypothetical protein MOV61_04480 [Neorhizobium sp. BETTINA12A]|uniref:COG3904 family protein n=1 Tax=Neorhizobium sp. BETTINA12A TaxID=2908924 RepID=UPI001FF596CB|nr:hypothetical protein [Neorhizobium sp. BETTINA12A]MCJ9749972.1 hypothetical protein [Neorhizobium sp. BETTINA12A]